MTAILTETNGGATTSYGYHVYLEQDSRGMIEEVFLGDDADKRPAIRWENANTLVVVIPCGRIFHYQNTFSAYNSETDYKTIHVGLKNSGLCKHFGG